MSLTFYKNNTKPQDIQELLVVIHNEQSQKSLKTPLKKYLDRRRNNIKVSPFVTNNRQDRLAELEKRLSKHLAMFSFDMLHSFQTRREHIPFSPFHLQL